MVTKMALSGSLSKFVDKVSENVSKLRERGYDASSCDEEDEEVDRPASPFFLLLSEGEEEFDLRRDSVDGQHLGKQHQHQRKQQQPKPSLQQEEQQEYVKTTASTTTTTQSTTETTLQSDGTTSMSSAEDNGITTSSDCLPNTYICCSSSLTNCQTTTSEEDIDLSQQRGKPDARPSCLLRREEFDRLFDHSGRLVNEHELRRNIFKNGIHPDVRKPVWEFLFELYPFNTTARERDILRVEQTVRYEAMKIRWKKLLKTLVNDYEGVAYCPKWYTGCSKQRKSVRNKTDDNTSMQADSHKESHYSDDSVQEENKLREENIEFIEQTHGLELHISNAVVGNCTNNNQQSDDESVCRNSTSSNANETTTTPTNISPLYSTTLSFESDISASSAPCKESSDLIMSTTADRCDISPTTSIATMTMGCSAETPSGGLSNTMSSVASLSDEILHCETSLKDTDSSDSLDDDECTEDTCNCGIREDSVALNRDKLNRLPPWIAQVMTASTASARKCKKRAKLKKLRGKTAASSSVVNPSDDFIRAMDEDITKRKALLDIVENANKYLKEREVNSEQVKTTSLNPPGQAPTTMTTATNTTATATSTTTNATSGASKTSEGGFHPIKLFNDVKKDFEVVLQDEEDGVDSDHSEDVVDSNCPYCGLDEDSMATIVLPSSEVGEDQLKFMQLQAQVYAARQSYNGKKVSASVRTIDKDVPRTDRELPMFSGNDSTHLVELRDALLTYAFFNPDVGYAQGMNDIMARFLVVMKKESEAYWMFVRYMEHFKHHFMEEGMLEKITMVEQLLHKMDRQLHDYLLNTDMGLMFCHRWLLLNFKREFPYAESLRVFEITSSRHLEVSSLQAELERSKQRAEEFVQDSAGSHLEEVFISPDIPFDIFICVAMLTECRDVLMATSDVTAVYEILSKLPNTLDLEVVLQKAEQLFYQYCRRTVVDCFQVIDVV